MTTPLRSPLNVDVRGDGPDLVMLHGGAGGIDDLALLRGRLTPGRRVISPDQRGHGRSSAAGEISYDAQAADTADLLDELGVRNADVLGWSDGGIVGLLLACHRPDLVGRLVAISANLAIAPPAPPWPTDAATAWLARATPGDLAMPPGRNTLPNAAAEWPETAGRILAMWRAGSPLLLSHLERIKATVLYVAGDNDIVRVEHTVAMFQATPRASLAIVPEADHRLVQLRADEVAAIVKAFHARTDASAGKERR